MRNMALFSSFLPITNKIDKLENYGYFRYYYVIMSERNIKDIFLRRSTCNELRIQGLCYW